MTPEERKVVLEKLRFFYVKNPAFRVTHVDGAIGGITPRGFIHMAVYSERPAIPQTTVHAVTNNVVGDATEAEGKEGIVRELDVDLMMSVEVAAEIRDWLTRQLDTVAQIRKSKITKNEG